MADKVESRNPDDWGYMTARKTAVITLIGAVLFVAACWLLTR